MTKDGPPGLTRFVPRRNGLSSEWADGRVLDIEVVFARRGFLKKLTAPVAEELVKADLDLKCRVSVLAI